MSKEQLIKQKEELDTKLRRLDLIEELRDYTWGDAISIESEVDREWLTTEVNKFVDQVTKFLEGSPTTTEVPTPTPPKNTPFESTKPKVEGVFEPGDSVNAVDEAGITRLGTVISADDEQGTVIINFSGLPKPIKLPEVSL